MSSAPGAACAVGSGGGPLPRHRRGAAGAEARRGGPDRHPAHPAPRQGARGGQGGAPHPVPLGGPAGAVQPRRRAVLHRPLAGHRHPGADRRRVRRRDHRRLPPLHRGLRDAGDRRPAGRRGGRAGAAGVPAAGRRDPGAGRPGAGPVAGAGRVPAAGHDPRRLGARDQRLRPLRRAGPAPGVQRRGRRSGLPALPPARLGHPVPRRRSRCSTRCCTGTGRSPTGRLRRPGATPAGWWPRTCSGTWSASCARCRWWSGAPAARPGRRRRTSGAAPARGRGVG